MILIVCCWPKASLKIIPLCYVQYARQAGVTGLGFAFSAFVSYTAVFATA
jgi:hypothetical protein